MPGPLLPPDETATEPADLSANVSLGPAGHRARMRARLLKAGPDSLNDQDLLEMVLFLALPRRDTKPMAKDLLFRFRSFAAAIAAPEADLARVPGLGAAGIAALKTVQAAALRLARAEVIARPVLKNWDALMDYLHARLGREKTEKFHVLFLDSRNRLLADEEQSRGTVNHAPVYPREVAKRALELGATALILVHNHPSGDPTPSTQDVKMTLDIIAIAAPLGVTVHDHIIVGRQGHASLRGLRLI